MMVVTMARGRQFETTNALHRVEFRFLPNAPLPERSAVVIMAVRPPRPVSRGVFAENPIKQGLAPLSGHGDNVVIMGAVLGGCFGLWRVAAHFALGNRKTPFLLGFSGFFIGAGRGIRTPDQRFTKPLRYHYAMPARNNSILPKNCGGSKTRFYAILKAAKR